MSKLSSKAKPFVPKSMKRARPAESTESVEGESEDVASKKRKVEEESDVNLQAAADQKSFYAAKSTETSPSSPTRALSSSSVGSEQEKMLLRAARFAKPVEVEEKVEEDEEDAMEEEEVDDADLENLLNDEESEI